MDATFGVDLVEISTLCFGNYGVGRQWSTIGSNIADLDFGVTRAKVVFLLRGRRSGNKHCNRDRSEQAMCADLHLHLPGDHSAGVVLSSAAPGLFALVNIRKTLIQRPDLSKFSRPQACSFASSSTKTLASFKSSVSKPSVNQP